MPHFNNDADVRRIQRALEDAGYPCSRDDAERLWEAHSDSMSAGWLVLCEKDADIVRAVKPFMGASA